MGTSIKRFDEFDPVDENDTGPTGFFGCSMRIAKERLGGHETDFILELQKQGTSTETLEGLTESALEIDLDTDLSDQAKKDLIQFLWDKIN